MQPEPSKITIYGARGGGSAIIEALCVLAQLPYDIDYMEWGAFDNPDGEFARINPMREVPALLLPNGNLLTESAAICLWIADHCPESTLVPPAVAPERPQFLRWLIWLVASVYPTFTYGDHPGRYVPEHCADALYAATEEKRQFLWRHMESSLPFTPFALGPTMTALDVYIAVMTRWRPRRDWFRQNCPKLYDIALRVDAVPELQAVWAENFN